MAKGMRRMWSQATVVALVYVKKRALNDKDVMTYRRNKEQRRRFTVKNQGIGEV